MKKPRIYSRDSSSQALVEFAIVLPLIILLLMAIIEFGWLIKNNMTVSNASREAARVAALGSSTPAIDTTATNAISPLHINSITMQYSANNGTTWSSWPSDVVTGGVTNNGVASGNLISINVTAYNSQIINFIPQLNNFLITQTTIITHE